MMEPLAVLPPAGSALGPRSLLRNAASLVATSLQRPRLDASGLPRGDGRVVLVIPAFLAGDWATTDLRQLLSRLGYRVETAGITVNLGPTPRLVAKLERAFLDTCSNRRVPVDLVGQSLGGVLARDLAARFPDRVGRVVTLCSPIRSPITTPLAPLARVLSPLYDQDWLARRQATIGALAVPVFALYSDEDGVIDWRECLQDENPTRTNIRVPGLHATIGTNVAALAAIARALSA